MNEELMDRQLQRELRGMILRALGTVYGRSPDSASFDSVARMCGVGRAAAEQRTLQLALQLVIDLGYVERDAPRRDCLDRDPATKFRLTGKGMQLLNGDIEDGSIGL